MPTSDATPTPAQPQPPDKKRAVVRRTRRWSSVWVVPIVAFLLAGWLVWQHFEGEGVLAYVQFETADGVVNGKTEIRCRSVKVGMVENTKLSKDLRSVKVAIRIDRNEQRLLRGGTRFWVVRPRVSGTDITGLGTLLTGAFIQMDPGDGPEGVYDFKGLEVPPVTSSNVPGLRLVLVADEGGSLSVSSPVYFKGFQVGQIESRNFDLKQKQTRFDVFIQEQYAELVHQGTCFWNSGGVDISAGAEGFRIRTPSLQAMFNGGVSFGLPQDAIPGDVAHNGNVYKLFKDESAAKASVFSPQQKILLLFNQSVRGLAKGAPVEFRGLPLGRVADISFKYAPEGEKRVPVLIEIDPKILRDAVQNREDEPGFLATAVQHGLRAKLGTSSFLTGALFIDIDFVPSAPPAELWHYGDYDVLPTVPSGLMQIEEKVNAILTKIEALPLDDTMKKFGTTAESITAAAAEARTALDEVHKLLAKDESQKIPAELDATLEQIRTSISSLGPNGAVQGDLRRTLDELRAALRSIKALSDNLEQKPNSLIFGNEKTGNPTPRARKN
jgi:paraquat-inducible protein B